MKNIFILIPIFLFTLASACQFDCPADEKIGDIMITEQSLVFFPYQGKQTLVFKNNFGNELKFTTPFGVVNDNSNNIAVYKTCTAVEFDGKSSYKYFEGQSKSVVFFSKPLLYAINFSLSTTILRPEEELFYDKLIFEVSSSGTIGRGEIITDIRFTESFQDEEFNIDSPLEFVEELTINGMVYQDVYKSEAFDGRQAFYTKTQGLIGFTDSDFIFNLDRIE